MSTDPRAFTVRNCDVGIQQGINSSTQRNTFFSNLGKLGQIQAINQSTGIFSKISGGLFNLAQISSTVQQGSSFSLINNVANAGLNAVSSGANSVLSMVGISPNFVQSTLQNFNPGAANSAINTAQNIAQQVSTGQFNLSNIPSVLQNLNSVESSIQSIYPGTIGNIVGPAQCAAYPYAMDLIAYAPKFKFLFFIQFLMNSPSEYDTTTEFAFVIQETSRPNIIFQYDDVNYNNFRTKVLKKTKFEDIKMKFFDDQTNSGTQFLKTYMNQMIPITNITGQSHTYQYNGMNFAKVPSSSSSPTNNDNFTPIRQINVFHVFGQGRLMNVYQFINPKITKMTFDDLSMKVGDQGNMINMNFQYDNVLIYPDISTDPKVQSTYNITELTQGGMYPLQYVSGNNSAEGNTMSQVTFKGGALTIGNSSAGNPLGGAGIMGSSAFRSPLSGAGILGSSAFSSAVIPSANITQSILSQLGSTGGSSIIGNGSGINTTYAGPGSTFGNGTTFSSGGSSQNQMFNQAFAGGSSSYVAQPSYLSGGQVTGSVSNQQQYSNAVQFAANTTPQNFAASSPLSPASPTVISV